MLRAALKSFLKCDASLNGLGKEIFSTAGSSGMLGVRLVTVTWMKFCQFVALYGAK